MPPWSLLSRCLLDGEAYGSISTCARRSSRLSGALRLDDLEHQSEVVEEPEEIRKLGGVAVDADLTGLDRLGNGQLAQDDPVQGGAIERDGGVRTVAPAVREVGKGAVLQIQHVG